MSLEGQGILVGCQWSRRGLLRLVELDSMRGESRMLHPNLLLTAPAPLSLTFSFGLLLVAEVLVVLLPVVLAFIAVILSFSVDFSVVLV